MPPLQVASRPTPALCAGALAALLAWAWPPACLAQAAATPPNSQRALQRDARRDGQRDFDFETGLWRTHVRRLAQSPGAAPRWLEYTGTTRVVAVHGGRANLAELAVAGPAGRIDGVALRLYEPAARQWRIHYANLGDGALTAPLAGRFVEGRGEFFGDDRVDGRPVRVRFRIHCPRPDRCLFEQALSADGGRRWQVNWLATDTRLRAGAGRTQR